MAILHARGLMKAGETMIHESIIGSRFTGRIVAETSVGGRPAIVGAIAGRAWLTGIDAILARPRAIPILRAMSSPTAGA